MKLLINFFLIFIVSVTTFSQQYFVEFIVDDIDTFEKAKDVEFKLRSNSDFDIVRMDFHTGRCYIIMKENIKRPETHFKDQFKKQGYEISCFYLGLRGKDPFLDIKRGDCK